MEQELMMSYEETEPLSRIFVNNSESYKFFWFQAILENVIDGKIEMTFADLADEMIADAWCTIAKYHLKLGPKDALEDIITYIQGTYKIESSADKNTIEEFLDCCSNSEIENEKHILIRNVPYRLQSPFLEDIKGDDWLIKKNKLIERINQKENLIYYFGEFCDMQTTITIQNKWYYYLRKNQGIITGWFRYNLLNYLQRRNPNISCTLDKIWS